MSTQPIQIIATLGPATKDEATLDALIKAGTQIARLNFSWGTHAEHRQFIQLARMSASRVGRKLPIMQDLSGPRVQQGAGHSYDPDVHVLTDKDRHDVLAMNDLAPEYIALSFVKDADDIRELRALLAGEGRRTNIIAKIERKEALHNIEEIILEADGIMIARGDLGQAVPVEQLPFVKKDVLRQCRIAHVPSIVATEMLTSMEHDPVPSRADVSDIAHAVLDGASATMLSNETAVGTNPVEAVAMMRRVVDEANKHAQNGSLVRFAV